MLILRRKHVSTIMDTTTQTHRRGQQEMSIGTPHLLVSHLTDDSTTMTIVLKIQRGYRCVTSVIRCEIIFYPADDPTSHNWWCC